MKIFLLPKMLATAALVAVVFGTTAAAQVPNTPVDQGTVVVHGEAPMTQIAPAWELGRTYKFGDFVNYDGFAFRAKTGSAHRRPDVSSDIGWEKLNPCDDKSKGAVQCEVGNQAAVTDTQGQAQAEYKKVKQDMTKGSDAMGPQ